MRPAVQGFLSLKTPTMASLNKDFALKIFFEENGYDKNEKKTWDNTLVWITRLQWYCGFRYR